MKQSVSGDRRPKRGEVPSDAQLIDAQYGLEPVIDISDSEGIPGATDGMEVHLVECPYCGEQFETPVDKSAGSARYIEDCQVCCQPIEFKLEVDHEGVVRSLSTLRGD